MQHDHILKKLNYDLLIPPQARGGGGGGGGSGHDYVLKKMNIAFAFLH